MIPRYLNSVGWVLGECEDLDRAIEISGLAAERARKWHHAVGVEMTAYSEINRADALITKGDLALAWEILDEVHRIVRNPSTHVWMKWRYSTRCFVNLGELWLARGDPARALGLADEALEIATRTNARKFVIWGWRLKGTAAAARRQWGEAEESLRRALAVAQTIDNPRQLWKTQFALGQLYAAMKKPELAGQAHEVGREVIDRVKANIRDPRLRAGLERAPVIREP